MAFHLKKKAIKYNLQKSMKIVSSSGSWGVTERMMKTKV